MFRNALTIARQWTFPVVISRRAVSGDCSSGIGSFVVINDQGWIVTAAHIMAELIKTIEQTKDVATHRAEVARIKADGAINAKERSAQLRALGHLHPDAAEECSAWWSFDGVNVVDVNVISEVDLCVARLEPFDPAAVAAFPIFKDPAIGIEPGAMLCKLGFPFHSITPDWDANARSFTFPPGAVPLPLFPMEGMVTRFVDVACAPAPAFTTQWIETSTPGLQGQSGGPTIDDQGVVWAIQSNTAHLHLGFNPPVPGGKNGEKEHQFLNVGRGVHVETILAFLDSLGVKYDKSAY